MRCRKSVALAIVLYVFSSELTQAQRSVPERFSDPVPITAAQARLLRDEAKSLRGRVDLASANQKAVFNPDLLMNAFGDELRNLQKTQEAFMKYSDGTGQRDAGSIYFADLSRRYSEARLVFSKGSKQEKPDGALIPMVANVVAYEEVASSGTLTFDLEVRSAPSGATITYWRVGDKGKDYNEPTNATIKNIAKAIWKVRARLSDGRTMEKEHDPYREKNHVLIFDFSR